MYVGRYVGPPVIWQWQRVPGDIGTSSPESVVVSGTRHYFVGPGDLYVFDGTVPQPIGDDVREWFFQHLNLPFKHKIRGAVDVPRSLIYWYYPSINSANGALDSVLIYNTRTGKWGKRSQSVQVPVLYVAPAVTYTDLGTRYTTYDALPTISYDSPFWLTDQTVPGVFQGNVLYSLTGEPGASWLHTGDFGDMTAWSFLSRVTPRYRKTPATGTAINYTRETLGHSRTTDATATMNRNRFDFRRSARWHSLRLEHQGQVTLDGLDVDLKAQTPE